MSPSLRSKLDAEATLKNVTYGNILVAEAPLELCPKVYEVNLMLRQR